MKPTKPIAIAALVTAFLLPATVSQAQMRPGAKVEKTYGLGLPRDMDKLVIDDHDYPEYPLKPGQEAYKDVDGYRIKDLIKKFTAISLKSLDDGEQYWGRITGTKYDKMTTELMADEFSKLGLKVTREAFTVKQLWYPTHWEGSYAAGGKAGQLLTLFPINETKPTPAAGIVAEAIWVGIGAAPDLLGRDLKGKAVLVYSTFVPGGRSHSASDRAGLFNSDTLITKAGAAMIINVMAVPGNGQFNPEGAPTGPDAVPTLTISQDEGFMLRDMLATGQKVQISLKLDIDQSREPAEPKCLRCAAGRLRRGGHGDVAHRRLLPGRHGQRQRDGHGDRHRAPLRCDPAGAAASHDGLRRDPRSPPRRNRARPDDSDA